ncbi:MAG: hypothetical protein HNEKOMLI_00735 [Sodalis sp. Psp]|nr:hypothetical protein [Sodalis sp. Psp]MCR3757288.1 hypothetical protein [Sodalis sp. Ppy]
MIRSREPDRIAAKRQALLVSLGMLLANNDRINNTQKAQVKKQSRRINAILQSYKL